MTRPEYWIATAAQGGFSSLSLPAAGYCGRGIVIYSDGNTVRCDDAGITVSVGATAPSYTPTLLSSGGPFGEPYAGWQTSVTAVGDALRIGSGDFTLEGWFRHKTEYPVSLFAILDTSNDTTVAGTAFTVYNSGMSGNPPSPYPGQAIFYEHPEFSARRIINQSSGEEEGWIHLAVARQGSSMGQWFNGRLIETIGFGTPATQPVAYDSAQIYSAGNDIGQIRYTPNLARYSGSTITVPAAPFR